MSAQTPGNTKLMAEAQRQTISALTQAHEAMLKTAEIALGSIPTQTPEPWKTPAAKEAVGSSYDFAGKVLAGQKAFALQLTELVGERFDEGRKSVAEALAQE